MTDVCVLCNDTAGEGNCVPCLKCKRRVCSGITGDCCSTFRCRSEGCAARLCYECIREDSNARRTYLPRFKCVVCKYRWILSISF